MKRLKGFTLVELVITIAIVIILSVVSVPIYRSYTKQAKMSEAYALLGTILSAQKAYYSQYANFLHSYDASGMKTSNDEVLGIDARGNKYFTLFVIGYTKGGDISKGFRTWVIKPEDMRGPGDKSALLLMYDITTGVTYKDNVSIG